MNGIRCAAPPSAAHSVLQSRTSADTQGQLDGTLPDRPEAFSCATAELASKEDEFRTGNLLGDRYRIDSHLSSGGSADILQATDMFTSQGVAIKRLRPALERNAAARARLGREAALLHRHQHPGLPVLHDVLRASGALVMELLEGRTLAEELAQNERIDRARVVAIIDALLVVLEYLHGVGVAHRDVKPANIILCDTPGAGFPIKLIDLGLAARFRSSEQQEKFTRSGVPLGSPLYMSPEHCRGRAISEKSDVYSAGVVLFELLTGQTPFSGATPVDVLSAHLSRAVPTIPASCATRQALANVAYRALIKDPAQRPTSGELRAQLADVPLA